jgi:nucleoid-associated protein YgaU
VGKDFRTGLILGLVLAVIAIIWVATRPNLSPQGQTPRASRAGPLDSGPQVADRASKPTDGSDAQSVPVRPPLDDARPSGDAGPPGLQSTLVNPPSDGSPPGGVPDLTIYERAEKIKTTRFHIVRPGETLSAIARQYYGSPDAWRKLLAANRKVIKDADRLAPGTKLIIPE